MLGRIARRLYGNSVVALHLRGQRAVPYLPPRRLAALRDARLRALVAHAAAHVPYYRELFRAERIDPREIRTAADLDHLPLLDKATVAADPARFRAASVRPEHGVTLRTSGSTGRPLTVLHDQRSVLANIAYGERERAVLTRLCGRPLGYREAYLQYPGVAMDRVWDYYQQWTYIPVRPKRLSGSVGAPIEKVVQDLNRFRPHVLVSFGAYLEVLCRTVVERGLPWPRPRVIVSVGEAISPEGQQFIETRLGSPVLQQYSACEALKIGFACERRVGLHLHEDLSYVKLVDARGRRVAPGESGEVVLTNLVNRGTVLINYRLGDLAVWADGRCPCGRTLPLLADLQGRVEDMLPLANGHQVHPRLVWRVIRERQDVLQYQLVQHTFDRYTLKLVMADETAFRGAVGALLPGLQELLGPVRIEAEYHDQPLSPPTGKLRLVRSLPRERAAAGLPLAGA